MGPRGLGGRDGYHSRPWEWLIYRSYESSGSRPLIVLDWRWKNDQLLSLPFHPLKDRPGPPTLPLLPRSPPNTTPPPPSSPNETSSPLHHPLAFRHPSRACRLV